MRKIIASVDIGSYELKMVVAEIIKGKPIILASTNVLSEGISKGKIVNTSKFLDTLKSGLKEINELLGVELKKVIVNIPEDDVEFEIMDGTIDIDNPDGVVLGSDIAKVIQKSVKTSIPENMELVSVVPIEFYIDGNNKVKNPKRAIAKKLSVKAVAMMAPKVEVYKILNLLNEANLEVSDIVFGSIGDYFAYSNKNTDEVAGIVINIGNDKSTISVFNKGVLINTSVINVGSGSIDNDIAFIYKISKENAKKLKENLALADTRNAQAHDIEELKNTYDEDITVNQYEISEIVASRIEEILKITKKQINTLTKREISYIIITGGLTEIRDFSLATENVYGKNATIGQINTIGVRNNKYSTAFGMIKYFNKKLILRDKDYSIFNIDELEEFSNCDKKINITSDSLLGKIFGYFFDN